MFSLKYMKIKIKVKNDCYMVKIETIRVIFCSVDRSY